MRSGLVQIADISPGDVFEVLVVEEEHVIEGLAPQAADKSFTNRIHVRRSHRRLNHPRARTLGNTVECGSELLVRGVESETSASSPPGSRSATAAPSILGRVPCCRYMGHPARPLVQQEEKEQGPEEQIIGLYEVAAPDVVGMVLDEGRPRLAATATLADGAHVLLHGVRRHVGNTAAARRSLIRSNAVSLGCGDFLRRITI